MLYCVIDLMGGDTLLLKTTVCRQVEIVKEFDETIGYIFPQKNKDSIQQE